MKKRIILFVVSVGLAMSLAACGGKKSGQNKPADYEKTLPDGYPVKNVDVTLTWWQGANPSMLTTASNRGDTDFGKLLTEKTGIKVKYIHPAQGQETEQFNLLISSGNYPDMISRNWKAYPGGPDAAISENIIIPLNDLMDKGCAPALKAYIESHPKEAAQFQSDAGNYFAFPSLVDDTILGVYNGGMIRKDYLDKAGLDVPETIEELDAALHAFKEQGVKIPLLVNPYMAYQDPVNAIVSGFGVANGLYVDNNKVKFGPLEKGYKDYVIQMKKWYDEGILDSEFATENNKRRDSLVAAGDVGVTYGAAGSVFGKLIPITKQNNPNAEFAPISLTDVKGKKPEFGHQENSICGLTAITTSCKNVELAAKFLDYGYTDEGVKIWVYGEEGKTYNMKDGIPTYTELITNPDKNGGLSMSESLAKFTGTGHQGPTINSKNYLLQYYNMPEQQEALKKWSDTNAINHILPVLYPTTDEDKELSGLKADIDTYREEMLYRFISGKEPIENYDNFVKTLKDMKVDRMIQIQQDVYDRFLKKAGN